MATAGVVSGSALPNPPDDAPRRGRNDTNDKMDTREDTESTPRDSRNGDQAPMTRSRTRNTGARPSIPDEARPPIPAAGNPKHRNLPRRPRQAKPRRKSPQYPQQGNESEESEEIHQNGSVSFRDIDLTLSKPGLVGRLTVLSAITVDSDSDKDSEEDSGVSIVVHDRLYLS
jgi:hypothetical protein